MITNNPITLTGKPVKRGKNTLVKILCPYCGLEHRLAPGLRVPPCNSTEAEYIVQIEEQKG